MGFLFLLCLTGQGHLQGRPRLSRRRSSTLEERILACVSVSEAWVETPATTAFKKGTKSILTFNTP